MIKAIDDPGRRSQMGFTLIELIIVIVISGIIAGMLAVFLQAPVQAYVDTARRARLTEAADTALRRFARDVRTALPNSVRVTAVGGAQYLEFIPTVGGGRYRQYPTAPLGAGDVLDFSAADTAFDVLGPVPVYGAGQSVAIFNMGPGSVADAYAGNNRAAVTTANGNAALFSSDAAPHTVGIAAQRFPSPSPAARFHVVALPVTYECNPALGVLRRYTGYGYLAAQPTAAALPAASDILVDRVAGCTILYDPAVTRVRTGLVTLSLHLSEDGDNVMLAQQVHVQNMP